MPNDIKNKPVNTLASIGADFRTYAKKLDRERLVQPTQKENEALIDYETRSQELRDLHASAGSNPNGEYFAQVDALSDMIDRANDRIAKERELRNMRYDKEYSRRVSGYASESSSIRRVSALAQHPNTAASATRLARSGVGYNRIQEHSLRATSEIERLREELDVKSRDSTVSPHEIENLGIRLNRAETRKAVYTNTLRMQAREGLDPESRLENLGKTERSVQAAMAAAGMRGAVGANRPVMVDGVNVNASMGVARQKEAELMQKFSTVMEKVNKDLEQFGKTTEENIKEAEGLKESLETVQGVIKQQSSGGGGGGILGRLLGAVQPLGNAAIVAGAAAHFGREVFINQSNQTLANQITAASQSNQIYDMRKAALNGDMTNLSLLASGALDLQTSEGNSMRRRERVIGGITAGAHIAAGAGAMIAAAPKALGVGLLDTALTGGQAEVGAAAAGLAIGAAGANQLASGGAEAVNVYNGVSAHAQELQRRQAILQLSQEMSHVTGDQRQAFYSFAMGARGAAIGGGAAGARFFSQSMNNAGMMDKMVNARISPEQFTQLAAMGLQQQGSVFDSSQVFSARGLERSGVMDMRTSMSMMGRLATAGANNPNANMASILETAFTKSLDSSKALSMVVEHTAAMAEKSTGGTMLGIDSTREAAKLITSGVDMNDPNRERAVRIAASGSEALNNIATDTSVNFTAMANVARLSRKTGMSRIMAQNITSMDNDTVAAIAAQMHRDPMAKTEESRRMLANLRYNGFGGLVNANGGFNTTAIQETLSNRATAMLQVGGTGLAMGTASGIETAQMAQLKAAIQSGKIARDEHHNIDLAAVQKQFPQLASSIEQSSPASGVAGGLRTVIGNIDALYNPNRTGSGAEKARLALTGEGGSAELKKADELATAGAQDMAKQAKFAAEQLGGAAKALEKINLATQALADKFKTGKDAEDFGKAAAESAATFANKAADIFAQKAAVQLGEYLNGQLKDTRGYVPPRNNTYKQ